MPTRDDMGENSRGGGSCCETKSALVRSIPERGKLGCCSGISLSLRDRPRVGSCCSVRDIGEPHIDFPRVDENPVSSARAHAGGRGCVRFVIGVPGTDFFWVGVVIPCSCRTAEWPLSTFRGLGKRTSLARRIGVELPDAVLKLSFRGGGVGGGVGYLLPDSGRDWRQRMGQPRSLRAPPSRVRLCLTVHRWGRGTHFQRTLILLRFLPNFQLPSRNLVRPQRIRLMG